MAVLAGEKYDAVIKDAYLTESMEKGTPGLFISYDTDAGNIDHTWFITPNTVDRLKENLLQCFGITAAELNDNAFLAKIGARIKGDRVKITTKEDEYNGNKRVVVQWMNPAGAKRVEPSNMKRIAGIFGGGPVSSPAYTNRNEPPPNDFGGITDEEPTF